MPKSDTALEAAQCRQHAMLLGALLIAPEHRICHRGYSGIRKDEGRSWWSSLILLFVLVMTLYWREVRASGRTGWVDLQDACSSTMSILIMYRPR